MTNLKRKASVSFEKYINAFQEFGESYLIPRDRLTDAEWDSLNNKLATDSLKMIPVTQDGQEYMKFKKISRHEKGKILLNAGALQTLDNITERLDSIGQVEGWEYKSKSGLNFEHARLPVGMMDAETINAIKDKFKEKGIELTIATTNKGKFLIINLEQYRNIIPDNYKPNNKLKYKMYNFPHVLLTQNVKSEIQNILNSPLSPEIKGGISPEMQIYTKEVLQKYEKLDVIDMHKLDEMAQQIRQNLIQELSNNKNIADKILKWDSLTPEQKRDLAQDINYIMGSQRANHSGRTIVAIGNMDPSTRGFFSPYYSQFGFNEYLLDDFNRCIGTIVHENVHRFQKNGTSAVPLTVRNYIYSIIDNDSPANYINDICECESRYVQAYVAQNFLQDFKTYYTQIQINANVINNIKLFDKCA